MRYPLLDGIRKMARYNPVPWGGTTAEVGQPEARWYDMPVSMGATWGGGALLSKGMKAAKLPGAGMLPTELATLGYQASQMGRQIDHAGRYGQQLGHQNPHLAAAIR